MMESLLMVLTLAIIDSLDPCLFVLFISVMTSTAFASARSLVRASVFFISGVICYYFLLGLLLRAALSQIAIEPKIFGAILLAYGLLTLIHGVIRMRSAGEMSCRQEDLTCRLASVLGLYEIRAASSIGSFAIGFLAAAALLPCTAGMYVVYNYLLKDAQLIEWALLTSLYNVTFVSPLVIISLILIASTRIPEVYWVITTRRDHMKIAGGLLAILVATYIIYTY